RAQGQADGIRRDRLALAELVHDRLGRVGEHRKPRQSNEAASALDRVDQAKNIVENLQIVRLRFELDELDVGDVEAFARLGQELAEKLIHGHPTPEPATPALLPLTKVASERQVSRPRPSGGPRYLFDDED